MPIDPNLESYLAKLDAALEQISVGDRAEIITEIKSHVLETQTKRPSQSLQDILTELGDPELVAKRYLQERHIQPRMPKREFSMLWLSSTIKWLVIGFLGTLSILVLIIGLIIWRFTPLVSVDELHNRVLLGGGIIKIQSSADKRKTEGTMLPALVKEQIKDLESKTCPVANHDSISKKTNI